MSKILNIPFRISLAKLDELHISDPLLEIEGWKMIHLSAAKVR